MIFGGGLDPATGVLQADVLVLPARGAPAWISVPTFRAPAWSACAAEDATSFIVAGGLLPEGCSATVTRLRWVNGALVAEDLPPLPHSLAGAGAAVIAGKFYVVGGVRSADARAAESTLWMLDLHDRVRGWQALEPIPGAGRVLALVSGQYDMLQVMGGRVADALGAGFSPVAEVWSYRPVPLEFTTRRGWQLGSPMPRAMAAGNALPSGQAHTYAAGGDDRPVLRPLDVRASGPRSVMLFHALTDAWVDTGIAFPAAGASVADLPGTGLVLLGGQGDTGPVHVQPIRRTRDLAWIDYAAVGGYFALLAGIGWYFSRRKETSAEFSLGSRTVPWWAAGISMFATGASAISFMAVPAQAFATNLVWVFPVVINVLCYFVQAYVIFPMLRRLQLTSTYEYLEHRFNLPLRLIASAQQIVFLSVGRAAIVLVLPAIAIATTTGLNVFVSVIVMGVLTTIYATVGGFRAVIWTEVFQGLLKFVAPLAMIGVCFYSLAGGAGEFVRLGRQYHKFDYALLTWDATVPALWIVTLYYFMQFTVQLAGDQPMIQRVFAAPLREVRRVAAMNVICSTLIGIVVNVMGLAIFAYFHAHPAQLDAGSQNDQIVPLFATQALPAGLAGVVIAAIFASAMATVASNMNSVATIFTEDFFRRWRPGASDAAQLRVLKVSSYAVGFLGTGMGLLLAGANLKSMLASWGVIMGLLGGGIVGVYCLGMLTTRANSRGAIAGALVSVAAMVGVRLWTPLHWTLYMPLAICVCMGAGYLVSLLAREPSRDLTGLTVFTPRPGAS